jgi:hypothetical protein
MPQALTEIRTHREVDLDDPTEALLRIRRHALLASRTSWLPPKPLDFPFVRRNPRFEICNALLLALLSFGQRGNE